jgi:hypothetical protein
MSINSDNYGSYSGRPCFEDCARLVVPGSGPKVSSCSDAMGCHTRAELPGRMCGNTRKLVICITRKDFFRRCGDGSNRIASRDVTA